MPQREQLIFEYSRAGRGASDPSPPTSVCNETPSEAMKRWLSVTCAAVRAIDTGVLSINSNSSVRPSTPFGGFKQSGFGRELGMHALEGYSEVKNVFYSTA